MKRLAGAVALYALFAVPLLTAALLYLGRLR